MRQRVRVGSRIFLTWLGVPFCLLIFAACGGVFVSEEGCTPKGECPYGDGQPHNYWWQPERVAVVSPSAGITIIAHELCHGWQGRNLPDDDISLEGWHRTAEGKAFPDLAWAWQAPAYGDLRLEDAAWTCVAWHLGWPLDDARATWANEWLNLD